MILLCLLHIHDVECCTLCFKLTFLGYMLAFILGRQISAHMVWKMVGRLRWCFSCRFPESSVGPKHVQLFFQAAGVTPGWACKRHLWYHCPAATVSLLNDVAICWPIPGAKGHYITASSHGLGRKLLVSALGDLYKAGRCFVSLSVTLSPLWSVDWHPRTLILSKASCFAMSTQTGIVQGLRKEYEGKVFFATLVLQGSAVCGAC